MPVATLYALLAAAQKRQFPIVDRARAIGRQVRQPALPDELIHDLHQAVLHQVRAVHQDHAGIALAGGRDGRGTLTNHFQRRRVTGARRLTRINEHSVERIQALPLGQRINLDLSEVKGLRECSHGQVTGFSFLHMAIRVNVPL